MSTLAKTGGCTYLLFVCLFLFSFVYFFKNSPLLPLCNAVLQADVGLFCSVLFCPFTYSPDYIPAS